MTTPLWTSDEIAAATGGTASAVFHVTGVTFDSREVQPGDLFVAMPGTVHDGHRFVEGAFASGAAGAIVAQPVDGPHVLVPDTDGSTTFPVDEPGYDSALGYQQTATIGAILTNSLQRMEEDSKQMGHAIDSLQQLLVSLPKPAEPEPSVENAPVAKPVR